MGNARSLLTVLLLAALLASAACTSGGVALPTPTRLPASSTPTAPLSTHEGAVIRATLPPTWTETPTPLPTLTRTSTPVTPTATLTPVPSLAELCDSFSVSYTFQDSHTFRWNDTIAMVFGTPLEAVIDPESENIVPLTVRFLATHMPSGENLGVELAGGQRFGMELPVSRLPLPGEYHWTAAVYGEGIGEQCLHQGTFSVERVDSATPEATSDATGEATAEMTDEVSG